METKQDIRKQVFARRNEAAMDQITADSHSITGKILSLDEFIRADWLFAYMDFKKEVMTRELIREAWQMGKRVAVPRVHGKDMTYYELTSFDQLEPGYFGIPEPAGCPEASPDVTEEVFLLVPGVAFDVYRHRVGYGQGFYDKYLSKHPAYTTCAAAFEFQIFELVPSEELDILPQILVTQERIFRA